MDASSSSSSSSRQLFVNDGSFLHRFKQLQEAQAAAASSGPMDSATPNLHTSSAIAHKRPALLSSSPRPNPPTPQALPSSPSPSPSPSPATGKLAFSLKHKPRPSVPALQLRDDGDGDGEGGNGCWDGNAKKQKLDTSFQDSKEIAETIPAPPTDPGVKKVAEKLAYFIAKNGRQFENVTRKKNPGDTPFRFLFDTSCPDYKYYAYRITQEEKLLAESRVNQSNQAAEHNSAAVHFAKMGLRQHTSYQIPASALYVGSSAVASDSLAMMEFYMKKAAQEDMRKPAKYVENEMPPPQYFETETTATVTTATATCKRGHHMGDYIPQEELEKFLAKCDDAMSVKSAKEASERAKIQADNVGHKLLSKMGWKEGEGLGSGNSGRADPVQAGTVKLNYLGVGAEQPGEVTPDDDIYEQYKKRMMLGYRFRPNPLNNPRKTYY